MRALNNPVVESCLDCRLRREGFFCNLSPEALQAFEAIKHTNLYTKGALLFVEGQVARGIYLLCQGRVKLSICSRSGKVRILRIAEEGEALGLSAMVSGTPYEVTAETLELCQISFVKKEDFLRFLHTYANASFRAAQHLSHIYHDAYVQIRSLKLSTSAAEKLAKLLLAWCGTSGKETEQGIYLKLTLTHEEIAEMIVTSRETVSRLLGEFKSKQIIDVKGSNLVVRDKGALEALTCE